MFFWFFGLIVCWVSKLDIEYADTFFLADTESQGLTSGPFAVKDRGIKAAPQPHDRLRKVQWYMFLAVILLHFIQNLFSFTCTIAAFMALALLFFSQPFFLSCWIQTSTPCISFIPFSHSNPHFSPQYFSHLHISDGTTKPHEPLGTHSKAETIAVVSQIHSRVLLHGQASLSSE